MRATLLSGKELSAEIRTEIKDRVRALAACGRVPGLAVVLVGEDPASQIYVRRKGQACEELGMYSIVSRLPENTAQDELLALIDSYNADERLHGILVQLPLPRHIDAAAVIERISPEKDVDGFHVINAGRLLCGLPGVLPCTPKGVMKLIARTGADLNGANAVVVGRSNIVGKPVSVLLQRENCTVTMCHSRTRDLAGVCAGADVLVSAIGQPGFITGDFIKPGAIVIDVGISRVDGRLAGDVKLEDAVEKAAYITPVPGGVGPMTITMLMENTVEACERFG